MGVCVPPQRHQQRGQRAAAAAFPPPRQQRGDAVRGDSGNRRRVCVVTRATQCGDEDGVVDVAAWGDRGAVGDAGVRQGVGVANTTPVEGFRRTRKPKMVNKRIVI